MAQRNTGWLSEISLTVKKKVKNAYDYIDMLSCATFA